MRLPLRIGEEFGGFVTREEFENYRLVVEFKWGTRTWGRRFNKAMDSGILLHCNGRTELRRFLDGLVEADHRSGCAIS